MTSWIREQKLLRLIWVLWEALTPTEREDLMPWIESDGMGWAIPNEMYLGPEDWVTPQQVALHLGITESTVRNWPKRYSLEVRNGLYRWGDVQRVRQEQNQRKARKNIA